MDTLKSNYEFDRVKQINFQNAILSYWGGNGFNQMNKNFNIQKQIKALWDANHWSWNAVNWQRDLMNSINRWSQANKSLFAKMSRLETLWNQIDQPEILENVDFSEDIDNLPNVEMVESGIKIDGEITSIEDLSNEITTNPKSAKSIKIIRLLCVLFVLIPNIFDSVQWWQEQADNLFNIINTADDNTAPESMDYNDRDLQVDIQSISESSMDFWDNDIDDRVWNDV